MLGIIGSGVTAATGKVGLEILSKPLNSENHNIPNGSYDNSKIVERRRNFDRDVSGGGGEGTSVTSDGKKSYGEARKGTVGRAKRVVAAGVSFNDSGSDEDETAVVPVALEINSGSNPVNNLKFDNPGYSIGYSRTQIDELNIKPNDAARRDSVGKKSSVAGNPIPAAQPVASQQATKAIPIKTFSVEF